MKKPGKNPDPHEHDHSAHDHDHSHGIHGQGDHHHDHDHGHVHSHDAGHDHHSHDDHHAHSHHDHGGHSHVGHHHGPQTRTGLIVALFVTGGIMLLEFFGGLFTNSLALLSDSGHMLSDVLALGISLFAMWFATRPPSPKRSYGYYRLEILAALFNGMTLLFVSGFIVYEAILRLSRPPEISSGIMMVIAAVGLAANLISAFAMTRSGDVKENINLRGAYLHVLSDAAGSVAALVAGALILAFGWTIVDPIASILMSLLILRAAWGLVSRAVHVLLEGTPANIDQSDVRSAIENIDGVVEVHDLHIWTISSGMDCLSCHVRISDGQEACAMLSKTVRLIENRFGIRHSTVQIENSAVTHEVLKI